METKRAKAAIEAILFAMGNSVEFQTIGKALETELEPGSLLRKIPRLMTDRIL